MAGVETLNPDPSQDDQGIGQSAPPARPRPAAPPHTTRTDPRCPTPQIPLGAAG